MQNLSSTQNNPNVIRLLRLIREWKIIKGFDFMPTEILDLTLSYATFSFKETGVFKVLLKFFTLLTLMLCRQNENIKSELNIFGFPEKPTFSVYVFISFQSDDNLLPFTKIISGKIWRTGLPDLSDLVCRNNISIDWVASLHPCNSLSRPELFVLIYAPS